MTSARTPSFAEVLEDVVSRRLDDVHTALPGVVESFDAATLCANVRLQLKERLTTETGAVVDQPYPVAVNVPVVFGGGGGFRVVFPLRAGDGVLVVFAEASIGLWQALGGEQPVGTPRRFSLADAIAIPGLNPSSTPWTGTPADGLSIGSDAGPGVVFRPTAVELGAREGQPATEAVVLGNAYRTTEDAMVDAVVAQLGVASTALTTAAASLAAAAAANSVPVVGGLLAAAPLGVVVSQLGVMAGAIGSAIAALNGFKTSAAGTLSNVVKTR